MPSTRRAFLAGTATAGVAGIGGCSVLASSRPDVNPATGLAQDTSQALADERVLVAGDADSLPEPPRPTDSFADATAVLATPTANRSLLRRAVYAGKPVAVAGDDPTATVRTLLDGVRSDYSYGVETVEARPVDLAVVAPRDDTVDTYTIVAEGGWNDPVLDPFGWALDGRLPECDTFVPESSMDDRFEDAGTATVVGRLSTGETYASRSRASVSRQDGDLFVRLRTTLHAAANDGYAVEEAVRETDLPDDRPLDDGYPNAHTQNGVQVANRSDFTRSTFGIEVTPASPRARSTLTGCGGFQTEAGLAYDHRTSFQWKDDGLLGADRHYGSATGRGEWHFHT